MKIRFDFDPQGAGNMRAISKELEGVKGYVLFVIDDDHVEAERYTNCSTNDLINLLLAMSRSCGELAEELQDTADELQQAAENGGSEDES